MFTAIKQSLKRFVPVGLMNRYYSWQYQREYRRACKALHSMPVEQAFSEIYRQQLWGGAGNDFCSGSGSDSEHTDRYIRCIQDFIAKHQIDTVVDLGCGDFRVGSRIADCVSRLHGVDIVAELIDRNRQLFGQQRVEFHCLNAAVDSLPDGDLCLIRQVLQHLSNSQISAVLDNCSRYRYLIVTEHFPGAGREFVPNRDKPHGPDIRMDYQSAVCLDLPPFNRRITEILCESHVEEDSSVIRTFLIES